MVTSNRTAPPRPVNADYSDKDLLIAIHCQTAAAVVKLVADLRLASMQSHVQGHIGVYDHIMLCGMANELEEIIERIIDPAIEAAEALPTRDEVDLAAMQRRVAESAQSPFNGN